MNKNISESLRAAKVVKAKEGECWLNAARLMYTPGFADATYVEGAVISHSHQANIAQEHAWVVLNGEVIDPTLPDKELFYFPALQWTGEDFQRVDFKYKEKPFFRLPAFTKAAVQLEMDQARGLAEQYVFALRKQ